MVGNSGKRKLAAIFSADAKDYSRLMDDDEEATVLTLTRYREVMFGLCPTGRLRMSRGGRCPKELPSPFCRSRI